MEKFYGKLPNMLHVMIEPNSLLQIIFQCPLHGVDSLGPTTVNFNAKLKCTLASCMYSSSQGWVHKNRHSIDSLSQLNILQKYVKKYPVRFLAAFPNLHLCIKVRVKQFLVSTFSSIHPGWCFTILRPSIVKTRTSLSVAVREISAQSCTNQ